MKRELVAILMADVVGYSRLMGADETATLTALKAHHSELIYPKVKAYHGRVVNRAGDSVLAQFPSIVDAVQCAVEIQRGMAERNIDVEADRRIDWRVGINLGDVIIDGDEIYGDGVNVAARLESLAEPGSICVSRPVRNQVRDKLPFEFEDIGEHEVKNIARPIRVFRVGLDEATDGKPASPQRRQIRNPRPMQWAGLVAVVSIAIIGIAIWQYSSITPEAEAKPSIAVLPFTLQGNGNQDDYFRDGITEDVISGLSKFPNLTVMSRNAVFVYKDKEIPPNQISSELRVRYLVNGSVRKVSNRVRVSVQLSDANNGVLHWSESYDEDVDDVFMVLDKIRHRVVGSLVGQLNLVEQERALAKLANLQAYDYALRGRWHFHKLTRKDNFKARALFEQAIKLDPHYASAYVWLARTHLNDAIFGWVERLGKSLENSKELAKRAASIDAYNGEAHAVLAENYTYEERGDLAAAEASKAIELNPNHAGAHAIRGSVYLSEGQLEQAVQYLETARRFNPQLDAGWSNLLAITYFLSDRPDESIALAEAIGSRNPEFAYSHVTLADVYCEAGKTALAEEAVNNVHRRAPFFDVTGFAQQYLHKDHRLRFVKAARKCGLK